MRRGTAVALSTAVSGLTLAYAAGVELRALRLRRVDVPVLTPGARPLRILQFSDMHLTPDQDWKIDWVRRLARLEPDLVVNSGDTLAHPDSVAPALRAMEPLLHLPGAFVSGSNDFYAPRFKNPARYLLPDTGRRMHGRRLPWAQLRQGMLDAGWTDLTNRRASLQVDDRTVDAAGVGDPHIWADRYGRVAGPVNPNAALALGIVHAPEPRVLDRFAQDGFALVLAGHTHGGQLRVPFVGALVTNCGLDTGRARGLSRWRDGTWLHVSAGLGTSPYAPARFACPPEATLLTLVPRQSAAEPPHP